MSEPCFQGWRIEDDDSHVKYWPGYGIRASSEESVRMNPRNRFETEALYEKVQQHIDWYNKVPTPFISVYNDEGRAAQEANRRVRTGKRNVVAYEIVVHRSDNVIFRNMVKLFNKVLDEEIPEFVGNNAENEFIFLHWIPEDCVVGILEFE
ncbi:hypothetical protein F4803DRAFT_208028 [Xylaria telfairii]|nr:hypothetical protein F4803DRAFT_208028 [Xylaria telfairii]